MVEGFEDYAEFKPARDVTSRHLFGALTGQAEAQTAYVDDKAVEGVWLHPLVDTVLELEHVNAYTPEQPLEVGVDLPLLAAAPLSYFAMPEAILAELPDFSIGL